MDITSRLELNTKTHPDKPAFIFFSPCKKQWETVTFQQLADSTQRFVSGLEAWDVASGMCAALMTPPSADFFALTFALLKLGIVPIIIDPAIGLRKVTECLAESKPDIFIGNTATHFLRRIYRWGKDTILVNTSITGLLRNKQYTSHISHINYSLPTTASSPAAIIYTSGSTGLPKGALHTRANIAAQLDMFAETFNLSSDEIDLPAFPLYALIDALIGVTSVIPDINFPVPGKTDPEKVINAIQQFNVTNMFASPVVLDILAKHADPAGSLRKYFLSSLLYADLTNRMDKYGIFRFFRSLKKQSIRTKLTSLKRVITAGAPATVQLQKNFRILLDDKTDLFGIYGATEVLPIAKIESREIFDDTQYKSAKGAGVCLGRPVNGMRVRIIKISDLAI